MKQKYVIDTTALISFFSSVFSVKCVISNQALSIIKKGFIDENILLFVPSIVFYEIFSKHFYNEEKAKEIKYEVFNKIRRQYNIAIEPLDIEVLECFIKIRDIEHDYNFDNHDKQIFATAMKHNCPLITSDENLIRYNKRMQYIPEIIS